MFLGAILVVAAAYYHDSMTTSAVAQGPSATTNRTMVNWDVVEANWDVFKVRAREGWDKLAARTSRG
ncbi:MAG: hypothetical protein ABUL48_06510 [Pseudorhodoplanes sp.]